MRRKCDDFDGPAWDDLLPRKKAAAGHSLELDQRNVAGEGRRPANVNRALPINFCGGTDEIAAQLQQAREVPTWSHVLTYHTNGGFSFFGTPMMRAVS